ncbi:MAG: glutamate-1-semialdehyde 2,1-aminomutase [Candidatus Nezhaarchaeota archaeon]|nr:glutamate-1-semialdehyde 2,1-aminomutase [Candidatus Nezhaarchaeota archaeon]MCX8141217.1 glutamate-1-semialdehyde 2,1-aminomutase [Candidatus Nezhaarchaeota archaeon]MDW8049483.1 glutamate-1-semialdehyde 2,1-aminomutase [Nitrososphaerota archaeon]
MEKSRRLFEEALTIFPGGVHSPVRGRVKPYPFYVDRAKGARLHTVDDLVLTDYCMAYGALMLGHGDLRVQEFIKSQLEKGWIYGAPTELELELAKLIMRHFKSIEKIRFVNSGCEATMLAVRIARAYTERDYVVKFDGCYHGANDVLLASRHLKPKGVLSEVSDKVLIARYNDYDDVESLFKKFGDQIACIIVEPVAANMGLVIPSIDFIKGLRELCNHYGSLLLFDEIVTGFRVCLGGAQNLYGIEPDITTLGKIIGGGFPIGAVGGRRDLLSLISPEGPVFNAGTFNAHPISMAAGIATLKILEEGGPHVVANKAAKTIADEVENYVNQLHLNVQVTCLASMFHFFFAEKPVKNYDDAQKSNTILYDKFHEKLLREGVFIPPSQFEVCFTSSSHDDEVVTSSLEKMKNVLRSLR